MFGRKKKNDIFNQVHVSHLSTLVPEVFLEIFLPERERASWEVETMSCEAARRERKTSGTLASNLTFMQTTGSGSDPWALIG